jgi:hypothetical protein
MEDEAAGLAALGDAAAGLLGEAGTPSRAVFDAALAALLAEPCDGSPMGRLILGRGSASAPIPATDADSWITDVLLSEAALDPGIGYRGFRFLIAAYALLKPAI